MTDTYWTETDIDECAIAADLALVDLHHVLGKEEDGISWKDETKFAPYTIFVFKKFD